jgi:predicted O-methyltransferase YrrM
VQARRVVEFGTSFGVSTIWLAAAVRDNGGGSVIGTEMVPAKAESARAHLREAGLADHVDIRTGDALETLRDLDGPVDLMLNDGFPDAALDVLRLVAPQLRPGAVVITDNVGVTRGGYADYVAWVRDPANGFISVRVPYRGGTEVSVRVD